MRDVGFRFEIVYSDAHLLEMRVSAWNGAFGGVARVYVGLDQLQKAAATLRGFPSSLADVRELYLGAFGSKSAPGRRVAMRFYCIDRSGHPCVDSTIESEPDANSKIQSVRLLLPVEAAAVDSFIEELSRLGANRVGAALLKGVPAEAGSHG